MKDIKLSSVSSNYAPPLKPTDTLKYAMNIMKEHTISSVIVVDTQQKPLGIFTERDVIKSISLNIDTGIFLEEIMTKNIFSVEEGMYIHDAYILMEQKNYRHLVVVNQQGVYLGVVTEGDFLRFMGLKELSKNKIIADAMSSTILTVLPENSLKQTATLMSEKQCDYAVIIKDNKPIGIVSERDITYYCLENENHVNESVSVLKNTQMYLVDKNTSLTEASNMMQEHNIHQLIVTDDTKQLIGLITRHDILKKLHGSYFDYLLETIKIKTENEKNLLKHKKELEKLANYDQLTGLPNRLFFQAYLHKSIANAIRAQRILGIILLDIDRFKGVNDSYGHTMGDELLKIISDRLMTRVRDGDLVARIGGDEFAIILEDLSQDEDVALVTKDILKMISKACTLSNGVQVHVDASAGVILAPKDAQSVEQTMQYADSALYQAKTDGHGTYRFYTDEMTQKAIQKLAYETALRNATSNGELEVYYQPQIHIKTGKIISAEALLRWHSKDNGVVAPDTFIPIAEETGLINTLGEWVMNQACIQGKKWLDKGYNLTIAVNVSPNQVKYQDLPSLINNALQTSGFLPSKLEIEITESSLMQREEDVVKLLHNLRAKGIRLAIDDFGTGYSSLSYLKRFPIDVLKIDKSFIDDIPYEKDDIAIVIAIIEMGKALGYQVLAEGIEYQEQLDFLEEKGCNLFQGHLRSKAIPAHEFEKLMEEQNA
jgi:diguanylate cyclase (GGDEF)-like protein